MPKRSEKVPAYRQPIPDEAAVRVVEVMRDMQYTHREFSRALRALYTHSPGGPESCHFFLHNLIVDMRSGFYRIGDTLATRSKAKDEYGRHISFNAMSQLKGLITFPEEYIKDRTPHKPETTDQAATRAAELWNQLQTHSTEIKDLIGSGDFLHNSAEWEVSNTIAAAYAEQAPTSYPLDHYPYPERLPAILPCDCSICTGDWKLPLDDED